VIPTRQVLTRGGGSGGQNLHKVANAVHLRFDIKASSLPGDVRERRLIEPLIQRRARGRQLDAGTSGDVTPGGQMLVGDDGQEGDAFGHQGQHFGDQSTPCGFERAEAVGDGQVGAGVEGTAQGLAGVGKIAAVDGAGGGAAAQFLEHNKGKCGKMHGHTFQIEVYFNVDQLDQSGIGIDFTVLKAYIKEILPDHKVLNEEFDFSPSAENLSRHFYKKIKEKYPVSKVLLWESDTAGAIYSE